MPSAKVGPDQKHALKALWRKWVFPPFGIDRLLHYILSVLPKFVGSALSLGLSLCRRRLPAALSRGHDAQTMRTVLMARATAATFGARRASSCTSHGRRVPFRTA